MWFTGDTKILSSVDVRMKCDVNKHPKKGWKGDMLLNRILVDSEFPVPRSLSLCSVLHHLVLPTCMSCFRGLHRCWVPAPDLIDLTCQFVSGTPYTLCMHR